MKKSVIFIVIIILILSTIFVSYEYYQANLRNLQKYNNEFDYCYNNEITGTDLATLINKAVDRNETNGVQKEGNKKYIEDEQNSIEIQIHMLDNDKVYDMESIYNGDIINFIEFYGNIKFKCSNVEYHSQSKKIKSLYFEQVSQ